VARRGKPSEAEQGERGDRREVALTHVGARARALDTLAQPRIEGPPGGGGEVGQALQKHARAKFMSTPLAAALAELRTALEKSYRNTVYCASERKQQTDGRIVSRWCGNRWCLGCNRIRTARAINRYEGPVMEWPDRWFVTLTTGPTVPGTELRGRLVDMLAAFNRVKDNLRKNYGAPLVALRKLECTYRPEAYRYHPHYHVLVSDETAAREFLRLWLAQWPEAVAAAQDIRRVDDARGLREVFKYFTKLVTKGPDGRASFVAPAQLDVIFESMRRCRVYQPVGFKVAGTDEEDEVGKDGDVQATSRLGEYVIWRWEQEHGDWMERVTYRDPETGEPREWIDEATGEVVELQVVERLSGYCPSKRVVKIAGTAGELGDRLDQDEHELITAHVPDEKREKMERILEDARDAAAWQRRKGWRKVPKI